MVRSRKNKTKGRSKRQSATLALAREALATKQEGGPAVDMIPSAEQRVKDLSAIVSYYQKQVELVKKKSWNERRRTYRLKKANHASKIRISDLKRMAKQLRLGFERKACELQGLREVSDITINDLRNRLDALWDSKYLLQNDHAKLKKRYKRLSEAWKALAKHEKDRRNKQRRVLQLTHKGIYSMQAPIQEIGNVLGIEVKDRMSKRTVLEGGVAADIQLAYEMVLADKLTYSSDSTSHRHIEYEACHIAIEVVDYLKPNAPPV
ncbi:hypothetical protein BDQ17DRAFT_1431414 [Cyathus striatus]|nr:hypothetical protein BDQ17DRAFT_1431414 [Cyathus striatus]